MPLVIHQLEPQAGTGADEHFAALVALLKEVAEGKKNNVSPESVENDVRQILKKIPDEVLVKDKVLASYLGYTASERAVVIKDCITHLVDMCEVARDDAIRQNNTAESLRASEADWYEVALQRLRVCETEIIKSVKEAKERLGPEEPVSTGLREVVIVEGLDNYSGPPKGAAMASVENALATHRLGVSDARRGAKKSSEEGAER